MPTPVAADILPLQCLYRWERTEPGRVVLSQPMGDGVVLDFTWGQVADQARRMAAHLQSQGWERGSKIAILSKNCAWWLISDLAIWMAGHVSVPLYPTLAPETIQQVLTHSESRACFVGKLDGWAAMKPGIPAGTLCISYPLSPADAKQSYDGWDAICARTAPLQGEPVRAGDELCTLMYTSGTTGMPKGVMHSFANFAWALSSAQSRIALSGQDRMLSYLPLAHVAERMLVEQNWLRNGPRIWFAESLATFNADLLRARPTLFFSVPRLWVKFQQGVHSKMAPGRLKLLLALPLIGGLVRRKVLGALGLNQCRIAAGGAAPMPPALLDWYSRLGLDIIEVYGMTENCGVSHATLPGQNQHGTVGMPYEGVETRIDPASGELQMRSPGVMQGYYKAPELTRESLTDDGWLHTGDKVALDARGCLSITGRVKDLFKTGKGKYVAPAPIEDRIGQHPAVEACVVTGANLSHALGLVMLSPDGLAQPPEQVQASLAAHLEAVNARLDPHETLACLVLLKTPWSVDNGIVTPTFKVKRNRIEELYGPKFEAWASQGKTVVWGD